MRYSVYVACQGSQVYVQAYHNLKNILGMEILRDWERRISAARRYSEVGSDSVGNATS